MVDHKDVNAAIRLMSYNIRYETDDDKGPDHWENRKAALAEYLRDSGADVIGLQEVTPNQREFLMQQLGDVYELFGRRKDEELQPENNVICFRKSRFKLGRHHTYFLAPNFDSDLAPSTHRGYYRFIFEARWRREQLLGAIEPRVVTCVELHDTFTKKHCFIFNAHLDLSPLGGFETTQHKQAQILADQIIPAFRGENDSCTTCPHVIIGDFNSTRTFGAPTLLHARGYLDTSGVMAGVTTNHPGTCPGFDPAKDASGNEQIDWIFAKGLEKFEDYKLHQDDVHDHADGKRRLSDHQPISVLLTL